MTRSELADEPGAGHAVQVDVPSAAARSGDTELGSSLYRQRGQLIEPIFGHTKDNRGFIRFHHRGRAAARTEWRLIAATHNLVKLHGHFNEPGD